MTMDWSEGRLHAVALEAALRAPISRPRSPDRCRTTDDTLLDLTESLAEPGGEG